MSKFLSLRKDEIADVEENLANQFIEDGLAEEYTLIEPTGTLEITANDTYDVSEYASAEVNVQATIATNCQITVTDTTNKTACEHAVVNSGALSMITDDLTSAGKTINSYQSVLGRIRIKSGTNQKVTVSSATNVKYCTCSAPDGDGSNNDGLVFWCYQATGSLTVAVSAKGGEQ